MKNMVRFNSTDTIKFHWRHIDELVVCEPWRGVALALQNMAAVAPTYQAPSLALLLLTDWLGRTLPATGRPSRRRLNPLAVRRVVVDVNGIEP
jgi:hypothetical protein